MPFLLAIPFMITAAVAGLVLCISGLREHRRRGGTPGMGLEAGFAETLRAVPLRLVIGLDLLDMGLDVLATPLVWLMLDRAGLKPLRNVAAIEAVIPFTQPIPLLTLCWAGLRIGDTLGLTGSPRGGATVQTAPANANRKRVENTAAR
jgi:hypothetical protein